MSKAVVSLRMPVDLKVRLESEAKHQGISLNQLSIYLLNSQITQIEMITSLETRLSNKSIPQLKKKVKKILEKVPSRDVPDWDKI